MIGGNIVISAAERLTVTLRFLATSKTFQSLSFQFSISDQAISYIIKEICNTIMKYLVPLYLKVPSTEDKWLSTYWQYPNAIQVINGKHKVIWKPSHGASHYYNCKHSNSIILMAIAGPNYECLYADTGTNGRVKDGGVWNKCGFLEALETQELSVPNPTAVESVILATLALHNICVNDKCC